MQKTGWTEGKRIVLFVSITFAITYALEIGVLGFGTALDGVPALGTTAIVAAMMFLPTLGMVLTRIITKEGWKNLGLRPANFRKSWKMLLVSAYGLVPFMLAGMTAFFLVFPDKFDPAFGYIRVPMLVSGIPQEQLWLVVLAQLASGVVLAPILNIVTCMGEEWGWRGYLLPKLLERYSIRKSCLVSGVIWGLWHAPLTVMGHNYGTDYAGWPWLGILAMCIFCTATGTIFAFLTVRANSSLAAGLAHGSLNGFGSAGLLLTPGAYVLNPFLGPNVSGLLGGLGLLVLGIFLFLRTSLWQLHPRRERDSTS